MTKELAKSLLTKLSGRKRRSLEEALSCERQVDWLSHAPLQHLGFLLDRQTFRDAVALRLGLDFPDPLPSTCPSCGADFDLRHALKCKSGNWVKRRHDEVKKAWMTLFKRVSPTVTAEPFLGPPDGMKKKSTTRDLEARCDILATGIFTSGDLALFDVAVIDTFADCYMDKKSITVLKEKEKKKRDKYEERVAAIGGSFAPLVCSVTGVMAPEASKILTLVVHGLDAERPEMKSTAKMLQVALQISVLKATSLGLRARARTLPPKSAQSPSLIDCPVSLADARPLADDAASAF